MANRGLGEAKANKADEFYTSYIDIEKEVAAYLDFDADTFRDKVVLLPCDDPEQSNFTKFFAQNFERLGLRKLVSTSYAPNSKQDGLTYQPTLFETESEAYDPAKSVTRGKIFVLELDRSGDGRIDVEDLEWSYLDGDGDFRSDEVRAFRDEADVVVTNPPFSLFRSFLLWVMEADKQLLILGNMNAITYKETFALIRQNRLWLGPSISSGDREFQVPSTYPLNAASSRIDEHGNRYIRVKGVRWFTNLDHGRRHQPLPLMTEEHNVKYSKHDVVRGVGYRRYDNYDAIEVPYTNAIPSDYDGLMGVPVSFIDKFSPDQFDLVGMSGNGELPPEHLIPGQARYDRPYLEGRRMFVRLFIRRRKDKS